MIIYILIVLVVVISLILLGISVLYNAFQVVIIKINESENSINSLLVKKLNILERIFNVIREKNKDKDSKYEIDKIKNMEINNFELNKKLFSCNKELNGIIDSNSVIRNDEDVVLILKELRDINEDIDANCKYYNDNVTEYNKCVSCFPSNLVALIFRFRKKEFYEKETEEMFEILKKQD